MQKKKKKDEALIVFLKIPQKGRVKTRLATDTDDDTALKVYKKLISLTFDRAAAYEKADVHLFFTGERGGDEAIPERFFIHSQKGENLGARMTNAFRKILGKGYSKVCIIGSDCPELESSHLGDAFSALDAVDVVVGPARDGGYYLLGMKKDDTAVFGLERWSHADVFEQTMQIIKEKKLSYAQLRQLSDLDDITDYNRLKHLLDKYEAR